MTLWQRFAHPFSHPVPYHGQSLIALGFISLQVAALAFILQQYEIEASLHLYELTLIALCGFLFFQVIPETLRPVFFLFLGVLALLLIAGSLPGLLILGVGASLIGLARHTRGDWRRYLLLALLIGILAGLAARDTDWAHENRVIFATLGSMFLFRMLLFLYERHHQPVQSTWIQDLSYFFLLPNMGVMLFPAVDYKRFLAGAAGERDLLVYKKGVQWMALGVFHLVLYRWVYYYLWLPVAEVRDARDFLHYATTNYAQVLRLSGIFHFVVGMTALFGYNLPQTFNNYFLARGFSDLWRRLNIYFRDFMVKVFYYPIFFRLRGMGVGLAMFITIQILFFLSWMIHSLQWFWLKGDFPLKMVDLIYWNLFGTLVAITALVELRFRQPAGQRPLWIRAITHTLHMLLTFLGMSLLWSLWSANSLAEYEVPVRLALSSSADTFRSIGQLFLAVWGLASLAYIVVERFRLSDFFNPAPASSLASLWSLAMIGSLLVLPLMKQPIESRFHWEMDGLLSAKLTDRDEHQQVEGYYTDILFGNNLTSPLADLASAKHHQFRNTQGAIVLFDYRGIVMRPNTSLTFKDKEFTINRWGGRDQDYTLEKPAGTVRTLFLGGSFVAGSGVHDQEVFDVFLEEKMNRNAEGQRFEFLNFGCPSYDLIDVIIQFQEEDLSKFQPDYLVFFSQGKDLFKNAKDLVSCYRQEIPIPLPFLRDILERSGIEPEMTEEQMLDRVEPFEAEIIAAGYQYLYQRCVDLGIVPVWAYWPTVNMRPAFLQAKDRVKVLAENAGFTVLDLTGIYDGYDPIELKVSEQDHHPNDRGHRIFAEALLRIFKNDFPLKSQ